MMTQQQHIEAIVEAGLGMVDAPHVIAIAGPPSAFDIIGRSYDRFWRWWCGNRQAHSAQWREALPHLAARAVATSSPAQLPLLITVGLFQSFAKTKLQEHIGPSIEISALRLAVHWRDVPGVFVQSAPAALPAVSLN